MRCFAVAGVLQPLVNSVRSLLKYAKERPIRTLIFFLLALFVLNAVYISACVVSSLLPDNESDTQARLDNAIWKAQLHGEKPSIPRTIHQIWINVNGNSLPERMVRCTATWKSLPCCQYTMWNESSATKFLTEHYPWFMPLWNTYYYDTNRADALKYFILFHFGGLYIDTDICMKHKNDPIKMLANKYLTNNEDAIVHTAIPSGLNLEILMFPPRHPFLKHCIFGLLHSFHYYMFGYLHGMLVGGPLFLNGRYRKYPSELAQRQLKLIPYEPETLTSQMSSVAVGLPGTATC